MAIEPLGRLFNVVPIAAGVGLSLKNAAGVMFICTGASTPTITVADSFAGSYATPGTIITRTYTNTSTNGSAAWVRTTQVASNAVTIAGATTTAFWIDAASLPDTKTYVKCTSAGLVAAIFCDLFAQRAPANLPAVGA